MTDASPTIRQRELGLRLRQLRTGLGLTVEDVAEKLLCSPAKISRMETGARRPVLRDVRDLCALYNVDEATTAEFMKLTRQAREPGWWTQYEDLKLSPYIGLEQEASSITAYSLYYVHALAQTEDYARTIIKALAPKIDPEIHQQRIEARLRRQQLLEGANRPNYRLLLDEAVLRRPVGGPTLMAAQLEKILKLSSAGAVTVQIIPFEVGAYFVGDISFTLLEFGEPFLSPIIFVEGMAGSQYYERPVDVALYRESIEQIRDSALTPRDSLQRLDDMRATYSNQ
ncbi:MAG TPA: helix-turn-helix transcriptional regulator [Trebonia sp.]|nr:helix-turn-helix transcriptional regulator [Trebonia sp.]